MTSPPREIEIECHRCGHRWETFFRPSWNLWLDPVTDEELEELTTVVCPVCAAVVALDTLVVENGVWTVSG